MTLTMWFANNPCLKFDLFIQILHALARWKQVPRCSANPYKAISLVTPMSVISRQFSARNSIENYDNLVTKFGRVKLVVK